MSSEMAIEIINISKCYQIYEHPSDRLKQFIYPRGRRMLGLAQQKYYREFWALRDISFEVKKGETVGVIGQNGSGKSTLLQIVCGTLNQTHGTVQKNGRVAALLELGSGFNPEFTGRENIYLGSSLLGLSNKQIEEIIEDVISFADIGNFIDQPVKTYSSGMFVRLAFSVNIMTAPDIMIVDEALAVGDMNFQAKCMTALNRLQNKGTAILFVSHDVGAVKSLCSKAVYLKNGLLVSSGSAPEVADLYVRNMREKLTENEHKFSRISSELTEEKNIVIQRNTITTKADIEFKKSELFNSFVEAHRYGSGGANIKFVELLDESGNAIELVEFNQLVKIRIYVELNTKKNISINFHIRDKNKINIAGSSFTHVNQPLISTDSEAKYIAEYVLKLPLQEGEYSIRVQITSPVAKELSADFLDVIEDALIFKVAKWTSSPLWCKVHLFPSLKLTQL